MIFSTWGRGGRGGSHEIREEIDWMRRYARQKARLHKHRSAKFDIRLTELEDAMAEQSLVCHVLHAMLLRKGDVTAEEFSAALRELDLLDGVEDGKLSKTTNPETGEDLEKPAPAKSPKKKRRRRRP